MYNRRTVAASLLLVALLALVASHKLGWGIGRSNPAAGSREDGKSAWIFGKKSGTSDRQDSGSERKFLSGPDYQLFSDDGSLNPNLLSLAGISASKSDKLRAVLDETWSSAGADLEARGVYLKEESDPAAGLRTFFVPADPASAAAREQELRSKLKTQFGAAAERILTPYLVNEGFFAGFGKYDLKISLKPGSSMGSPTNTMRYSVSNPGSGEIIAGGSSSDPESYKLRFANAFLTRTE